MMRKHRGRERRRRLFDRRYERLVAPLGITLDEAVRRRKSGEYEDSVYGIELDQYIWMTESA